MGTSPKGVEDKERGGAGRRRGGSVEEDKESVKFRMNREQCHSITNLLNILNSDSGVYRFDHSRLPSLLLSLPSNFEIFLRIRHPSLPRIDT